MKALVVDDSQKWKEWAQRLLPWGVFAALLVWGWRAIDLFHTIPSYGDVLEVLWAIDWYDEALRHGQNPLVYSLAFHPQGWNLMTFALGPANFVLLLPLSWLGGPAFAYNVATLLTHVIAFAGALKLARGFVSNLAAAVVALLYTFWGLRWYNNVGGLNIALVSAILPWMLWCLERGFASPRRLPWWYALTGALWAVCINSTLYSIWLGGVALFVWILGRLGISASNWRRVGPSILMLPIFAGVLSLPMIALYAQAIQAAAAPPFSIYDVNVLGGSLNSLPIPSPSHPLLGGVARLIYHGPPDGEPNLVNFGFVGFVMALVGAWASWRLPRWRPVLMLAAVGVILALGLTLKWDDQPIKLGLLRPLNELIWPIGYRLKPSFYFVGPHPPEGFTQVIPLPGLLLATLVPFFSQARVFTRYGLLASLTVFLLAGYGLDQVKRRWLRAGLAALLILEAVPPPTQSLVFPPSSHPAFAWLKQRSLDGDGIVDLYSDSDSRLALVMGGHTVWATRDHQQATVAGTSSIIPGHTAYLVRWLAEHPHPAQNPDFVSLLRFFRVKYLLLHMYGEGPAERLAEAKQSKELRFVECFPPVSAATLYRYPICVLEVLPSPTPSFNVLFKEGWSGAEDWGRWIDGTEAHATWIATNKGEHQINLEAFPQCVPGRQQEVLVEVNGAPVATHRWMDCQPWSDSIPISGDLVKIGPNDMTIRAGYAARPADLEGGASSDTRQLSIGWSKLRVEEVVPQN